MDVRKLRLAVFIIFCIISNVQGQSFPFPLENAEWHTRKVSLYCIGGSNANYYWTEFVEGDTLIDNVAYANLMLWPECIYVNAGSHCQERYLYPDDGINAVGGIREVNGRVLFKKYNVHDSLFITYESCLRNLLAGEEIILYDYNWKSGDSVIYPRHGNEPLIFDIVGFNVLDGRKRVGLQQRGKPAWCFWQSIEGMGGKEGLFNMYYPDQTAGAYAGHNVCCIVNGELVQEGSCTSQCELVSTDDPVIEQLPLSPNPTNDEFTIGSSTDSNPFVVKIFNLFGQLVYSDTRFETGKSISAVKLGLHGLLFVVRYELNGQISTGKLLIY
ncbi:MAG: T9SS type A sorting domain-containing protein [Chitinophagales bacterium]